MKNMARSKNAFYIVYDENDEIVMVGEICDICKRLDVVKSTITKALNNNSVIRRRYRIYPESDNSNEKR